MRTLLIALLLLAIPATALAARKPTDGERKKIAQAAQRSKQADFFDCLKVDHIKVSTKGPWAGGSLRSCDDPVDVIFGLFSKRASGKWKLRATGNGSVGCDIAPVKVQKDLDLGCA